MKKLIFLPAILLLTFNAFSQPAFPIDKETKKITYTEVVEINRTIKKATIETRISNWVKEKKYLAKTKQEPTSFAFKGNIVLVYPSATTGKNEKGVVEFVCTLYPKDGRYKYVISNFKHNGINGRGSGGDLENSAPECGKYVLPLGSWAKIKAEVHKQMPEIIADMKSNIVATSVAQKKKNPADF